MNFMFSFVVCNVSHKNKNKWQQFKYNKMTCEKMEDQTNVLNYFLKNNVHIRLELI
jgi:hypothetical protein